MSVRAVAEMITRVTGVLVKVPEITKERFNEPSYRASVDSDELWLKLVNNSVPVN